MTFVVPVAVAASVMLVTVVLLAFEASPRMSVPAFAVLAAPKVRDCETIEPLAPPIRSAPLAIVIPPLNVLAPVRVCVPVPVFAKIIVPNVFLMTPLNVPEPLFTPTVRVWVLF